MKCVVTGASGFIGSHLVRGLKVRGDDILCIPHTTPYEEMQSQFLEFKPEIVYHLAALYIRDHKPSDVPDLVKSNVLFGTEILECLRLSGCKEIVSASSTWQASESECSVNLYAATKTAFEAIACYYSSLGINDRYYIISNSFGPCDTRNKLIPALMIAAISGEEINLPSSDYEMDFNYIDNIVQGLIKDDVTDDFCVSMETLVRAIETVSEKKIKAKYGAIKIPNKYPIAIGATINNQFIKWIEITWEWFKEHT